MKSLVLLSTLWMVLIWKTTTANNVPSEKGSFRNKTGILATRDDLIRYIADISGSHTITGQHNREPNSDPTKWTRVVRDITGVLPGLWGGDFLFLPDDVNNRQSMVYEAIQQWNAGSLVALTWHVCPPTVGETCNWDSNGILGSLNDNQWNDLITDGGNLNNRWKARLDTIVPFLRQLENAGVISIWRPVHEINEGWSWWGGRPGANGSRKLYQITYDYYTQYHGLHSLVWAWCVKDTQMQSIGDYWPGGNYVDVATLDVWVNKFSTDSDYQRMLDVAGNIPIALGEVGAVPTPAILARQSRWTWFMVWAEYLKDPAFNSDQGVKDTYYDSRCYHQGDIDIIGSENIARGRPAFASSEQDSTMAARNAVDGSMNSRWSSSTTSEQWIYIDLGRSRTITLVKLFWEAAYAKGFQIQTSTDNVSWRTVYENYNGSGGVTTIPLASVSGRYVKMYAFERATNYGYSLFEFEVYA